MNSNPPPFHLHPQKTNYVKDHKTTILLAIFLLAI